MANGLSFQYSGLGFIVRDHANGGQKIAIVRVPVRPGEDKTERQARAARQWLARHSY